MGFEKLKDRGHTVGNYGRMIVVRHLDILKIRSELLHRPSPSTRVLDGHRAILVALGDYQRQMSLAYSRDDILAVGFETERGRRDCG